MSEASNNRTHPALFSPDEAVAYLHLDSWLERSVEQRSGPIQSYAARLPKEWAPAYDRAWANRIFLFLNIFYPQTKFLFQRFTFFNPVRVQFEQRRFYHAFQVFPV